MSGGGQERGIRSGTVPTHLVVGLGEACEVAAAEMATDSEHVRLLEARLRQGIQGRLQGVVLNGPDDPQHRCAALAPGCWRGLASGLAGERRAGRLQAAAGRGGDDTIPAQGF